MVEAFCPKCGKEQDNTDLCSDCTNKQVAVGYIAPLIQISEFERTFHKGVWRHFEDIEDLVVIRVQEALGEAVPIDVPPFEFIPQPKEKTKFTVIAHINDKEVPLEVKMSYMQCDFGQKQKTAYFEGVMQLREPNDRVIDFMNREMKQLAPKGVFITKTVDQKNGVDLYFTNKTHMRILGQKIGTKFGAAVSSHAQLFSHNHLRSKDVFRVNILVTCPKFMVGDIISFEYPRKGHMTVLIKSIGKICQGVDVNTQKNVGFELKNCEDIVAYKALPTTVSSIHPEIGILDPETFQEEYPRNVQGKKFEVGEKVMVIKTPKGLYIAD